MIGIYPSRHSAPISLLLSFLSSSPRVDASLTSMPQLQPYPAVSPTLLKLYPVILLSSYQELVKILLMKLNVAGKADNLL